MSVAVDTVNAILEVIFRHVQAAWPERTEVSVARDLFDTMVASTPRKPMGMFLAAFGPRASFLFAKDATLFDHLSLREYWCGMSDASQHIVWLALVQVYILALAITCLPPEALAVIEEMARSRATLIRDGHCDARRITQHARNGIY